MKNKIYSYIQKVVAEILSDEEAKLQKVLNFGKLGKAFDKASSKYGYLAQNLWTIKTQTIGDGILTRTLILESSLPSNGNTGSNDRINQNILQLIISITKEVYKVEGYSPIRQGKGSFSFVVQIKDGEGDTINRKVKCNVVILPPVTAQEGSRVQIQYIV